MAKPPYFPFYVNDFISDPYVELMSTTAVGAYILLLCRSWHLDPPASLPDDDRQLARWARLTADEWTEVRPEVLLAFTLGSDSRLHQKRLRQEYERFIARSRSASKNGKKGGRTSDGKAVAKRQLCDSKARASDSDSDSESSSPDGKKKTTRKHTPRAREPNPIWDVIAEIWHEGAVKPPHAGHVGKQVKAFTELEATPDDIRTRRANLERSWSGIPVTADALIKHWHEAKHRRTQGTGRYPAPSDAGRAQERRAERRRRDFAEPDEPIPDPFAAGDERR